jgi:hypothetical protein
MFYLLRSMLHNGCDIKILSNVFAIGEVLILFNVSLYPKFFRAKRKRICAEAFEKAAAGYSVLYDVHVFL